jgi:hypothetical protein
VSFSGVLDTNSNDLSDRRPRPQALQARLSFLASLERQLKNEIKEREATLPTQWVNET